MHLNYSGRFPILTTTRRTDGATRKPDGDLGLVMKSGVNLQYTELAPGATAPMVRVVIHLSERRLIVIVFSTEPLH